MGLRSVRRIALLAGFALFWVPSVAHAAVQIRVPSGCIYGSSSDTPQTIPYNLAGLAPSGHYVVTLDGKQVATGNADASGAASGEFPAPLIRHAERHAVVSVTDGQTSDSHTIDLTDFDAAVTPSTGSTRRAVRISLWGWVRKTVYLHWIPPHSRKAASTARITKTGGTCGHATARLPHLFPAGAKKGRWKLIFDTSRKLSKSTNPLRIEYDITVR
jgi:hypothetical protein